MIGVRVTALNSDNFFDSEKVMKALNESQRRVLSRFGAFVRTTARHLIKKARETEASKARRRAGIMRDASGHFIKGSGKLSEKKFAKMYEASKPGEPPRSRQGDLRKFIFFGYEPEDQNVVIGPVLVGGRASDTPARLEAGGEFRTKRGRVIKVAKRPFMKPAFDKEMAKMPAMFADSLFGG